VEDESASAETTIADRTAKILVIDTFDCICRLGRDLANNSRTPSHSLFADGSARAPARLACPINQHSARMTSNSEMTYPADSSRSSNGEALPYADLRPTTPDTMPMTILSKCPRCCDFPPSRRSMLVTLAGAAVAVLASPGCPEAASSVVHSADVAAKAPFAPISITGGVLADEALTLFAK
jgi:hypothetical protein